MEQQIIQIHWLAFTLWLEIKYFEPIWKEHFEESLGMLEEVGYGGRGFRSRRKALAEAKVYYDPINQSGNEFLHVELPGQACEAIEPDRLHQIIFDLNFHHNFNVTRLDVAFDHVNFTPKQFYKAIRKGHIRSLAKRETLRKDSSPFMKQEQGDQEGCTTVYFGSGSSSRSIRVYNKRGFTRVEIVFKFERADAIAKEVMSKPPTEWPNLFTAHLLDFIDLVENGDGERLDFWENFVQGNKRAKLEISDSRLVDLNKSIEWIQKQVSPALSVVADVVGDQAIDAFIHLGRNKRGPRYKSLLDTKIEIDKGETNV